MNRIFTFNFFKGSLKVIAVLMIVCSSAFIQPNIARAENVSLDTDIQAKSIQCYPNPAISFINFDIPAAFISKNYLLQVYSFTGKKMFEFNITTAKLTLTFNSEFYRGIYVYQLRDKNGRILETGKFQVNR
jgi:hypothetical protein